MPIDPSISLHVNELPAGVQPTNPMGIMDTVGKFAGIQAQLNQNQLFRQTFAARQKAGEILSTAPDLESAITQLQQDPLTGPFAGETINSLRQSQLALTQVQGEQQKQSQDAFQAFLKSLPGTAADPSQFSHNVDAQMSLMSPTARARVAPAIQAITRGLTDGLPSDPTGAKALFNQRLSGLMIGGGVTPEALRGVYGTPGQVDTGAGIQPTMTAPPQAGGGMTSVGPAIPKTGIAPTLTDLPGPGGQTTKAIVGGAGEGSNPLSLGGPAGGSGGLSITPLASSPTKSQGEYMTHRGADAADYEKNVDDRVLNGQSLRKNVGEIVGAMKDASTGGGAETYMKIGQALQAIGVKNSTVDKWANGSNAASTVIDKVSLQDSMSQLKQQLTGVGGSRLNAQEFVAYLNKNPGLTTDPRAAMQVFNLWNQFYDRDRAEQDMLDLAKQGKPTGDKILDSKLDGKPVDMGRWPGLFASSQYMKDFAPGGPISAAGVKGVPQPEPVKKPAGKARRSLEELFK